MRQRGGADSLLTTAEAAARTGVGERTFKTYAAELGVEPRIVGRSYLWAGEDVDRVIAWFDVGEEED